MNLKSIEYFLCAAEEMNITRAAERLFISQQALSSHISRLEEEYHVRLFERRPTLRLTPEGQQMVFYGQQILNSEALMRSAFSDISKDCRATLYMGISRLRADAFFPLIWKFYHPAHPNISIELVDGSSAALDDMLQMGKIDFYIGVDIPDKPSLARIELAKEKLQCSFTEGLLQTYYPDSWESLLEEFQSGVDLLKIQKLPFITPRAGNRLRKGLDQFLSQHFRPYFLLESNQQDLDYQLSRNGDGVGLLSPVIYYQHRYDKETQNPAFHVLPILNEIPENILYFAYRENRPLPQYAKDFIGDVTMVFKNYSRSISRHFK